MPMQNLKKESSTKAREIHVKDFFDYIIHFSCTHVAVIQKELVLFFKVNCFSKFLIFQGDRQASLQVSHAEDSRESHAGACEQHRRQVPHQRGRKDTEAADAVCRTTDRKSALIAALPLCLVDRHLLNYRNQKYTDESSNSACTVSPYEAIFCAYFWPGPLLPYDCFSATLLERLTSSVSRILNVMPVAMSLSISALPRPAAGVNTPPCKARA